MHVHKVGSQRIFRDGVLEGLFLLQLSGLRDDEILVVGRQFRFRARHVQRRHGADLQLFLVVVVEFFCDRDGLLLHVHVLPSVD